MTGISYTVTVDDSDVREKLAAMLARMGDRQGFYKNVGKYLLDSTKDTFAREAAPDGAPWKKLKPATIKGRKRDGHTPLTILRRHFSDQSLSATINARPTNDHVSIGSSVPYAAIHQLGGIINIPARAGKVYRHLDPKTKILSRKFVAKDKANHITDVNIAAYTITIPARPYLGLSKQDQEIIIEIADDWLRG